MANFVTFRGILFGWLALILTAELRAGDTAMELATGVSILENWSPDQHVYRVGNLGVAPEQLATLEQWIDRNAPNWTVLLMESSAGETYTDVTGEMHRDIDAVEHAMGKGLPARTTFGELRDPETGNANGAFFILFLKDRKFSYYGSQAYEQYQLGSRQWQGNLDGAAIDAMRNGGRIVDASRNTIELIDGRYRRAKLALAQIHAKNLQEAREGMAAMKNRIEDAERNFEEFRKTLAEDATGPFSEIPMDDWQTSYASLEELAKDENTPLQQSELRVLRGKLDLWENGLADFLEKRPLLNRVQEEVDALSSNDPKLKDSLAAVRSKMEKANAEYRNGKPFYQETLKDVEFGIANFYRSQEKAEAKKQMAAVAGATGTGFLGLLGFLGNRRRRRIKLEAEKLLEVRQSEMKEMSDRLFQMMDRAAIVVGPVDELESRGYQGETLALSRESLRKIDEAFVLSSNVQKIIEEAESLMDPANPLVKSRNLVSGGRYEEAVDLLDAEVRAEAKLVPDLNERTRPGEEREDVFAMPLDEWKGRTKDALDQAERDLDLVDDAWTTIVARRESLDEAIKEIIAAKPKIEDEWLHCQRTFEAWVPAMQSALLEGVEVGKSDPVRALRSSLSDGDRMAAEAKSMLDVVAEFRKNNWGNLEESENLLHERKRSTKWIDGVLESVSALCDEIAEAGVPHSVSDRIEDLEQGFVGFSERLKSAVQVTIRADDVCGPAIQSANSLVVRVRRELGGLLKLDAEELLVEDLRNPSTYLAEARLQFDGSLAALDLGEVESARGFLDEVDALVERAQKLVAESKRSHAEYPAASEGLWQRRGQLEDLAKKAGQKVEAMRTRYAPSALLVEVDDESSATFADAPDRIEGFLVGMVKCLEKAKSAVSSGRLLEGWELIEEGRELAKSGELLCGEISSRQEALGELEEKNKVALAARLRERDDLEKLLGDRRVTKETIAEFAVLKTKIEQARQAVEEPEGRIEPYRAEGLLDEVALKIPIAAHAIEDDLASFADAGRLLETVKLALVNARGLCTTAQTDRIPDSRRTTEALLQVDTREREWDEARTAMEVDHGDWQEVQNRLRSIHLGLSQAVMSLRSELELAREAVRFIETGSRDVTRAARWSGSYGVRISGRPGASALDNAHGSMIHGNYQAAMEWAGRAQSEARSAIASAEAEETARRMAEQRRRQERERAARRSRMNSSRAGFGSSSFGSSSSGSSSRRSSGGSSFGSSSSSSRSGGSSVGRSSFSSSSGVGRSGW